MKLAIYIDGLNLYYGALKKTPYKWLNAKSLVKNILPDHLSIANIKYFTARISPVMGNLDAPLRQSLYIRALKTLKDVEIEEGHFLTHIVHSLSVPKDCSYKNLEEMLEKQTLKTVRVLKREEKGTDVNLASHLLVDAFENKYKGAVIVSNDSDLFTPMQISESSSQCNSTESILEKRFCQDFIYTRKYFNFSMGFQAV